MNRYGTRLVAASLVGAMTLLAGAAPAAAAPKVKDAIKAPKGNTAATTPVIHDDIVGVPGSLHDVTRALGITDTSPTGAGVGVALIDTGVSDVPALRHANVTLGPDFSFDGLAGEDLAHDTNGHGTHLASLIVGTDKAWTEGDHRRLPGRQLGVAPDADLISIKAGAHDGAVDVSQVIAAVNWVIKHRAEHNIRVLSLSYGTDSDQSWQSDPLSYAVERAWHAGIVVVVSTGNDGPQADHLSNPATNPWILAVGAADTIGDGWLSSRGRAVAADFSTTTSGLLSTVDLVAPGRSIVGARLVGGHADTMNAAGRIGSDLVRGTGSSQSAALVAGVAAALLEARPDLSPDQVRAVLEDSGRPVDGQGTTYWWAAFPDLVAAVDHGGLVDGVIGGLLGSVDDVQLERAQGTGSLDAARGTQRIVLGGEAISGDVDVVGNDFSSTRWATDSWASSEWLALSWNDTDWTQRSWNDVAWNGYSWNGYSWNGYSWNGYSWNGYSWNGYSWNGYSWNGLSWQ